MRLKQWCERMEENTSVEENLSWKQIYDLACPTLAEITDGGEQLSEQGFTDEQMLDMIHTDLVRIAEAVAARGIWNEDGEVER